MESGPSTRGFRFRGSVREKTASLPVVTEEDDIVRYAGEARRVEPPWGFLAQAILPRADTVRIQCPLPE